jgi:hypothetical protein
VDGLSFECGPGARTPGPARHGEDRRYTLFSNPIAGSPPKYEFPAKNDPDATFSMNRSVEDAPYRTTLFVGTVST